MFPAGAVSWLQSNEQPVILFNEYNWGGYLIYNLPDEKVFVDGRTDLYGDDILAEYVSIMKAGEGWNVLLGDYGVDTLLLERDSTLEYVAQLEGWKVVFRDATSVVLREP